MDELLRFVCLYEPQEDGEKLKFMCNSIYLLNCPKNNRIYSLKDLSLDLSWHAKSRTLYETLRTYLPLPCLSTLRNLTRVANNIDDTKFFSSVFNATDERNRGCVLIIDESYIKATVAYRGGSIFGCPGKVATTFLCVLVKCFFVSKHFLVKLLPCHELKAIFQFEVITEVIQQLESCGAKVVALINDNNRVNQSFFSCFKAMNQSTPWIVKSPVDEN
ncbi:transposable element p transposase [Plakobranchus ocellatus]|uniref:Transposable element p transposase n=1 Tax=Plakobranchus ocellatus TaxID=259542 RepID=A0AAV4C3G7_9GAST|nr:transposable element p transposase [Plakobranchus ocellatus]